jgi:hypothetical protein
MGAMFGPPVEVEEVGSDCPRYEREARRGTPRREFGKDDWGGLERRGFNVNG